MSTKGQAPTALDVPAGSAEQIERDVRRAIIRLKVSIEQAERHLGLKIRPPLVTCFQLWSDLREVEALLKRNDPKPTNPPNAVDEARR